MQWTPQQDGALSAVSSWLRSPTQVFRLFGYAGTGKTTLAKHLATGVDGDVAFAAYTGKAALVLKQKGCPNAKTIHSLIYSAKEKSKQRLEQLIGQLEFAVVNNLPRGECELLARKIEDERKELSQPTFKRKTPGSIGEYKLIIIDECSMVGEEMGYDLLSHNIKVLVLGDPAQLPPVRSGGFFTEAEPDVMLTDIQRQARDNPIIELATRVRQGKELDLGHYGNSRVIKRSQVQLEEIIESDQLLVGLNMTRQASNTRLRHVLGRDSLLPLQGDRLVCLRNEREIGLLNGGLFEATTDATEISDIVTMGVRSTDIEGAEPLVVDAHLGPFIGEKVEMPWWERKAAQEFDYGYALTVHKAQGSQWNDVTLLDEWHRPESRNRWLYTGITRAAEEITIVKM